jgi:tRNA nucleotidyltransferase (CCA-adding enzyme)
MKIYLVGGAVRDELLGRAVRERDWVVVGSTPEALRALGYRQVGRDFPVFLHPDTGEEYALARTERKTGAGHTGFVCHAGPEVTLEQDLLRRDITVNAIARSASGELIDPFGGQADLRACVLRHVSDAFIEDPLRLFRVARFAAQLPGFAVASETQTLLRSMVAQKQLHELSAERVWAELEKALACPSPARFFEVLADADAWEPWLTEFRSVPPFWPEGRALPAASALRFGVLCWSLTPSAVSGLCERLRAPKRQQRLAEAVTRHAATLLRWREQAPDVALDGLTGIGAFAAGHYPEDALRVIECCSGQSLDDLRTALAAAATVRAADFAGKGLQGPALGTAIRAARAERIRNAQDRGQNHQGGPLNP